MQTGVRIGVWRGEPSITLVAGAHDATFLPGCGMVCASLRHRGDEFVAWPRPPTDIEPPGRSAAPISFWWPPSRHVSGAPRREWVLRWPACDHVLVDARVLPTGELVGQSAQRAALAARTFDDHYALGSDR